MNVHRLPHFLIAVLVITTLAKGQSRLYVDRDASGANNGLSWPDAYNTVTGVKDALDYASTHPSVTEIWVASGTYKAAGPGGSRTATHQLKNGVGLYGGFAGGETSLGQRNATLNATTLSGDLNGDDTSVPCAQDVPDCNSNGSVCNDGECIIANNNGENSYHVVTADSTNASALLDGFSIISGNANDVSPPHNSGGGVSNNSGSPTIVRCLFAGNAAANGAGLYNFNGGPTVTDCSFIGNAASSTGGGVSASMNTPFILNCTFVNNSAATGGGMRSGSNAAITSCIFRNNRAVSAGGGLRLSSGNTVVTDCTIVGNTANSGGGFFTNGAGSFVNCRILGNIAVLSGGGGASANGTLTFANCLLAGNATLSASDGGGGLYNTGSLNLFNCTLYGNTTTAEGGGLYNSTGFPEITNSIFWSNSSDVDGSQGGPFVSEYSQIFRFSEAPTVNYSSVQFGWTGPGGTGVLSVDPQFADADGLDNILGTVDDDFRLSDGSPAVDAGDNNALPLDFADLDGDTNSSESLPLDLTGLNRRADDPFAADTGNAGVTGPPIVDMGAHEFVRSIVFVDINALGANDGSSWIDAFTALPDALAFVAVNPIITEIWVAAGTYRPDQGNGITLGDRAATFQMLNGVSIYGGFVGGEILVSQRDPTMNVTILSGDLSGDDADIPCLIDSPDCDSLGGSRCLGGTCAIRENIEENSFHVVTGTGVDSTAVLDGFAIRAGNADVPCMPGCVDDSHGGGLFAISGSPAIRNCHFEGHYAEYGGAAVNMQGSSAYFDNCTFARNLSAIQGGAVLATGGAPTFAGCRFDLNTAAVGGAAANVAASSSFLDCTFSSNLSSSGGAVDSNGTATVSYNRCHFDSNVSSAIGGAIHDSGDTSSHIIASVFRHNTADVGGGAVWATGGTPVIVNSKFLSNSCGLLFGGGAIGFEAVTGADVVGSVFVGNMADDGGALNLCCGSTAMVRLSTLFGNEAVSIGGGIRQEDGSLTLSNSVLWNNSDNGGSGETAQVHVDMGSTVVDYSIVQGGWTGMGVSNLNADPLFIDADGVDNVVGNDDDILQLTSDSPAIDAGNSAASALDTLDVDVDGDTAELLPIDLLGRARFWDTPTTIDTGVPFGPYPVVDMGALEFFIDCNHNNIPDDCDLSCGMAGGPCDLPGCGSSFDIDMNGRPDECADFGGGCEKASLDWSCFDNWNIPGDVYPDNSPEVTYDVTLDSSDDVLLDVDATIDSLNMVAGPMLPFPSPPILRIIQAGASGDLVISTDVGLTIEGTILVSQDRSIAVPFGSIILRRDSNLPTVRASYAKDPMSSAVSASLSCQSLRIEGGSTVELNDVMSLDVALDLVLAGGTSTPCTNDGGKTWPVKRAFGGSFVNIGRHLVLDGSVEFISMSSNPIMVGGDFLNASDTPECFDCEQGAMSLNGTGEQVYEVGGDDLGAYIIGFGHPSGHTNYSFGQLEISNNGPLHAVRFENGHANVDSIGPCRESLYVHNLIMQAGATIVLDNARVYYETLVDNGASITTVGCGQLVQIGTSCVPSPFCGDDNACTFDCSFDGGPCAHFEMEYGNVNGSPVQLPNLDDILCVLGGFSNLNSCPNADIKGNTVTPCAPNLVINLDDILAVLGAFAGVDPCGCTP